MLRKALGDPQTNSELQKALKRGRLHVEHVEQILKFRRCVRDMDTTQCGSFISCSHLSLSLIITVRGCSRGIKLGLVSMNGVETALKEMNSLLKTLRSQLLLFRERYRNTNPAKIMSLPTLHEPNCAFDGMIKAQFQDVENLLKDVMSFSVFPFVVIGLVHRSVRFCVLFVCACLVVCVRVCVCVVFDMVSALTVGNYQPLTWLAGWLCC